MLLNRIKYGMLFIVSLLLMLFFHNYFFFVWMIVVAILPLFSYFVGKYAFQNTAISLDIASSYLEVGVDIPIEIIVKNKTMFPMPGMHLLLYVENQFYPNDEVQDIALPVHGKTKSYFWSVQSIYAGRVRVELRSIWMQDYLGLFRFRKECTEESVVSILPKQSKVIMNAIETSFHDGDEQELDTVNSVEDVTQVKEIREYRPGDRLQRVHWKLSTKQDDLYVKEFEREYNQTITLLVELKRDLQEIGYLDMIVTAFYSTACRLIQEEIQFQVQWYDVEQDRFQTERVEEEDALLDVLQQMFMMKSYKDFYAYEKYTSAEHKKHDMAIYFTPPSFGDVSEEQVIGTYDNKVMIVCLN